MNGDYKEPEVYGLNGMLQNYETCAKNIAISESAELAPLLKEIKKIIKP